MKFPLSLQLSMTKYLISNRIRGVRRFPLVLMLEPTHRCNLSCAGCGRIREYKDTLDRELSLEEALEAVEECPAPVVTITGGEPLIYRHIAPLVAETLNRKRHVILCTNGVLLEESLVLFRPTSRFTLNVHLDGPQETHDLVVGAKGVYSRALEGIRKAKKMGFRVTTNTTIYRETDPKELEKLLRVLQAEAVDGMLLAPAYHYEDVDDGLFLKRQEIMGKFRQISHLTSRYRIISTPLYMEFLRGERHLPCTPWGNPTRNPNGWKSPCYLITDTHYATFAELMEKTPWERYVSGEDPRCSSCMMHSGFEPSVVLGLGRNLRDLIRMTIWNLT
jgi:hopanoid biosynthesis associated radical SAM protein HpnH